MKKKELKREMEERLGNEHHMGYDPARDESKKYAHGIPSQERAMDGVFMEIRSLWLLMEDLRLGNRISPVDVSRKEYEDTIRKSWKALTYFEKLLAQSEPLPIQLEGNTVIVRPFDDGAFLKTKLLIPAGAKEKSMLDIYKEHPMQGIVLNAGPGFVMDSGMRRSVNYGFGDHVLIDHSRQGMLADFILGGVLYYKFVDSLIIGKVRRSYSNGLEDLKFISKA